VHSTAVDAGTLRTNFPKTVGADKAWAAGFTGKGVGVAVIDSGINGGASMSAPGATTSGLAMPSGVTPRLENDASVSSAVPLAPA
jgi:subtilisin family serine protease